MINGILAYIAFFLDEVKSLPHSLIAAQNYAISKKAAHAAPHTPTS